MLHEHAFKEHMSQSGVSYSGEILSDGKIYRFATNNNGSKDGWYVSYGIAGAYGDWSKGIKKTWAISNSNLTPNQRQDLAEKMELCKKIREEEIQLRQLEVAENASIEWAGFSLEGTSHYLKTKKVSDFGIRFGEDYIAIPLRDIEGNLWSLQKIYPNGEKRFLTGGRKKGCFHTIGKIEADKPIYIAEGYATGASIYMATHMPVVVALDTGNIAVVIEALRSVYPTLDITIAADDDQWKSVNTGKTAAEEASKKYGCNYILPVFHQPIPEGLYPTDFNDLHVLQGLEAVQTQLEASKENEDNKRSFNVVTLKEFLSRTLPPREAMLSPWLSTQSLNMIYSARGVGKTHVALGIAYAVASGKEFIGWKADKPWGVLYLDGEMPGNSLQERLALMTLTMGKEFPEENFRLMTPDLQNGAMPDLGTIEGQQLVDQHILPSTKLIVVDNLSCLLRGTGSENEAESWQGIGQWALLKRTQGISIIFIHHAGKSGKQRGTSKREDILDTVIALSHPKDYNPEEGANFEVHFEKSRHLSGKSVESFTAKLTADENGKPKWITLPLEDSNRQKVLELQKTGLSNAEIANELDINRSTVYRILKRVEPKHLSLQKPLPLNYDINKS
jgi:putative DNA primase/helicase